MVVYRIKEVYDFLCVFDTGIWFAADFMMLMWIQIHSL